MGWLKLLLIAFAELNVDAATLTKFPSSDAYNPYELYRITIFVH